MHGLQARELAQLHEQELMRSAMMSRQARRARAERQRATVGAWWRRLTHRPLPSGAPAVSPGR